MDQTSTLPTFYTAPPQIQRGSPGFTPGAGAISGGLLRPGAIDQPQFKAMLQAAQAANGTIPQAGAGPLPPPTPPSAMDGIPTLTPAQFALLTGGQAAPESQTPAAGASVEPAGPRNLVSGKPASGDPTAPTPIPASALAPDPAAATPAPDAGQKAGALKAEAETAQKPDQALDQAPGQDTKKEDPRVVHFKRMPDKDERKALSASGKRWVVDETPGSRKLFFGDDEVFGWDDLADLVNPLQHIPGVAQIYRAVTGDKINGAAELLGALPFGPSSFISSVADLAVREATGKDMSDNVIAMLFGSGDKPADDGPTDDGLAAAGDNAIPGGSGPQTAARQIAENPRADGRIFDRDNGGHDS